MGVVEAALTAALVAAGCTPSHVLTGVLIYRLVSFWLVLAVGLACSPYRTGVLSPQMQLTDRHGRVACPATRPGSLPWRTRDDGRRIAALGASRRVLTEDAAATLRRLERDLHDGTQARLISLDMMLRRAESRVEDPTARQLVGNAGRLVAETARELRGIIRGVHPPALDDGLGTALAGLASASAVPATFTDQLAAPVTGPAAASLYFAAAELLSNAARHSGAHHADVSLTRVGPCVRLTLSDDGHGGATASRTGTGTGLAGLQRRVQALDDRVQVHSPPGGPTLITVDIADC